MIDEAPALAVAAAFARGQTVIRDAAELRAKESDRIATTVSQLVVLGANITEQQDGMTIEGGGPRSLRGGEVESFGDHRLAMALAVAGLASSEVRLRDADAVGVSYPTFWSDLAKLSE